MSISLLVHLFILSTLSTLTINTINITHAYNKCLDDQKTLLLELKQELIFDSSFSTKLIQWNQTDDCCSWEGVVCDSAGHVTRLQLDSEGISGIIENSSSLFSFKYLEKLNMAYNALNGTIPTSLFSIPSLHQLKLSNNRFSGRLDGFSTLNLSNIKELDLSNNLLLGSLPQSIFKLESLEYLFLHNNFFNGTFRLENIQWLRNLTALNLSYNNLSVDANSNRSGFSTLPQLSSLVLVSCNLQNLPDLRNQPYLRFLDLSNNRIRGGIPNWIWEVGSGQLWQLNLSYNLLTDLQMPYDIPRSLQVLDLHSNLLRGELPLPKELSFYVDYSNNNFDKPIPRHIGNYLSNLVFFSAANNSLIGTIPTSLCKAVYLQVLDLSFNNMSGAIPLCLFRSIKNLGVFNLRRNNISGDIPDTFSDDCVLETLDLNSNKLQGKIPESLGNCNSLVAVNVGNNNLYDDFPCMLSSSLRVLVLRSNRFHGEVRCDKDWPDLQIIDIASNDLSGSLSTISFSSWRGMMVDSDAQLRRNRLQFNFLNPNNLYYHDEVTLIMKGLQLNLVKIWSEYIIIDFSCNNFQGEIPDAIGELNSLYLLNLSHNTLTGSIPTSLGNLTQLGSLDLSVNQLTGKIPVDLAGLTFLQAFNVSHNKLVGVIPTGPQFLTFPVDYFEGNAGLCGFPLNISCSSTDGHDLSQVELEDIQGIKWDYVSAALGYIVGLASIFWLLFCSPSMRRRYFEKVDEVLEMISDCCERRTRRRRSKNQVSRP